MREAEREVRVAVDAATVAEMLAEGREAGREVTVA